jgi:hypothetical protein
MDRLTVCLSGLRQSWRSVSVRPPTHFPIYCNEGRPLLSRHSVTLLLHAKTKIKDLLYYIQIYNAHSTQTAIMPKSCIICSAVASPELQLLYCATCQSALYCSKACQREDWKKHHKKICKFLNVGHGDRQVRNDVHTSRLMQMKEQYKLEERSFNEPVKQFFKLFQESTLEGSRAAALEMTKIVRPQEKENLKFLFFHSFYLLVRCDSEMLSWPNSPLLVLLQFLDPNVLSGDEGTPLAQGEVRTTALHYLADLADPFDYSTHKNQLILAKQLVERGADVNTVSRPKRDTPLHKACSAVNVTNLDFVQYLLEVGADPNVQDHRGLTPLMFSGSCAPSAAKFLLNWPTTHVNVTTRSGGSFLDSVRSIITTFSDYTEKVEGQFLLQQWREVEDMLVKRGAQ